MKKSMTSLMEEKSLTDFVVPFAKCISLQNGPILLFFLQNVQSGASNRAKIGGAYFSDVTGSIQDPIAVPGPSDVTEP